MCSLDTITPVRLHGGRGKLMMRSRQLPSSFPPPHRLPSSFWVRRRVRVMMLGWQLDAIAPEHQDATLLTLHPNTKMLHSGM